MPDLRSARKKVLIADFFGSVKERGIAAYVRDLDTIASPMADTIVLRAPAWVRRRSQAVQNLLMVVHEQFIIPIHVLLKRPDLIIFPYNSSSFLLSLSPKTVCVIHDLIPYRLENRGSRFAFAYVACTARWHARLRRRLVAVSPFTARTLRALPRFRHCDVVTIPNCFTALPIDTIASTTVAPRRRVTLISGAGPNKAFTRALELIATAATDEKLADVAFDVVGFGPEYQRAIAAINEMRARGMEFPPITVHPLLPRKELDALIRENAVTWAHSTAEGFGRVVVEGRMAGRPVLMSRLPVFRSLADAFTFSYRNDDTLQFKEALTEALKASAFIRPYKLVDALRTQATAGFRTLLSK